MVSKFRITIDAGSDGLGTLPSDFEILTTFPHYRDVAAMWAGDEEPVPGQRYVIVIDAEDEKQAEARVREIVGPDLNVRITPHSGRVQP